MDAGARAKRLLQRREYAAKVSGSMDRVPDNIRDWYNLDGKDIFDENRFADMALRALDKSQNFYNKITTNQKTGKKNLLGKGLNFLFKAKNPGGQYGGADNPGKGTFGEANAEQMKAMHDAKMRKKEDDMKKKKKVDEACWKGYEKKGMKTMFGKRYPNCVKKTKKEEVQLEAKKSCGEGEYYCHDRKKCMPIPKGSKVGKDGMLVKEDMKGMSQKSGDKRSTESGAGMTAKGVAKYNRRTGGNLKTAVTTPPSKLKPGSKAAKRRKSFCARSKSWTGPRGKAARRRWNCSYEPELPMIIDEKKLYNGAPLSDRVAAWAKKINEGSPLTPGRNEYGYPSGVKSNIKKNIKTKPIDPKNLPVAMASYEPQGDVISELNFKDIKRNVKTTIDNFGSGLKVIRDAIKNPGTGVNPNTRKALELNKTLNQSYEPQGEMVERKMTGHEKDKKEDYVKGMKKDKKGFTKRYGKDAKSVMYATATKMAMKKEAVSVFNDPRVIKHLGGKDNIKKFGITDTGNLSKEVDPQINSGGKIVNPMAKVTDFTQGINAIKNNKSKFDKLMNTNSYQPEGQMIEAKDEKKKSVKGIAKELDKAVAMHKSQAKRLRSAGVSEDFYQKRYAGVGKGYETVGKNKRMDKSNKRGGDSKAQHRELHKDLKKYKLKKLKTEGSLHSWFKGSKSKDGKGGWVNVVTGGTCASDKPGEGTPKCVSSAKRASMSKSERLSASRRKKKADPGQQSKSGAAKPTYVATDSKKKK